MCAVLCGRSRPTGVAGSSAGRLAGQMLIAGLLFLFLMTSVAQARKPPAHLQMPPDADNLFVIWPGRGIPPGSEGWASPERTVEAPGPGKADLMAQNVVIPTITMFRPPAGKANGTSLVIAPGGAFYCLMVGGEGYDVARRLTEHGITGFVLKYRVVRVPDDPEEMKKLSAELEKELRLARPLDVNPPAPTSAAESVRLLAEANGRQAIRFIRAHAAGWGLAPERIGIIGFSAGGEVALAAALEHDAQSRPDFAAGIYPAFRKDAPVPPDAPPIFLAIGDDDRYVSPLSTARFYENWHKAGKSAELHIFAQGRHGFGVGRLNMLSDQWFDLFINWLRAKGFTP